MKFDINVKSFFLTFISMATYTRFNNW